MKLTWPCVLAVTGVVAFLPILIHLIIGQHISVTTLALEYLGWYFFTFILLSIALQLYLASRREGTS